jgi:hypothetical protein
MAESHSGEKTQRGHQNGSNRAHPNLPHRLGEDSNGFAAKGEIQGALS